MLDVLVVGGSLAGASAAVHLAEAGCKVRLIERASFPRRKACGEGLFARGVEALQDLDVLDSVLEDARVLDALRLDGGGSSVEGSLDPSPYPAIGVRRELLDSVLLDRARQAGVDVRTGVTAIGLVPSASTFRRIETTEGAMEAHLIVVADGLRSRLRRAAGLDAPTAQKRYGISARYRLPIDAPARVHICLFPGHELYLTPVGHDLVNVALLFHKASAVQFGGNLTVAFDSVVRESGVLPRGSVMADLPLAVGPFPASARRLWRHNLVLAGDAAGFFDGISGEGMSLTLQSSRTVAQAALTYLETSSTAGFDHYEQTRRRLVRNSTLLARISLLLAAHPLLARRVIANLSRHPQTFEKVLRINSGGSTLATFRPRDLTCLLFGS